MLLSSNLNVLVSDVRSPFDGNYFNKFVKIFLIYKIIIDIKNKEML